MSTEGDLQFWNLVSELKAIPVAERDIHEALGLGRLGDNYAANFTAVATGRCDSCTLSDAVNTLKEMLRKRRGDQAAAPTKREADGDGDDEQDGAASAIPVCEPGQATPPTSREQQPMSNPPNAADSVTKQSSDAGKQTHTAGAATPTECSAFAKGVAGAVKVFECKHVVPTGYAKPQLPGGRTSLTLSEWYHEVNKANAYPPSTMPKLKADQAARAACLGAEVRRVFGVTKSRVSLWMFDGAGQVVFQLLAYLLAAVWTDAELDARLELSLVDWIKDMNDYHAWAIPCATVRRGNIHTLIANSDAGALPQVVYFNYSTTTTKETTMDVYEPGSWPSSRYSTATCMKHTATSCNKLLKAYPQAGLIVGFSMVRAAKQNDKKLRAAVADAALKAEEVGTNREAFATWKVTSKQTAVADDSSTPSADEATSPSNPKMSDAGATRVADGPGPAPPGADEATRAAGAPPAGADKDKERFWFLADQALNMSDDDVLQLLGYEPSGSLTKARERVRFIADGRSRKCTRAQAITILEAKLALRTSSQQAAAAADDSTTPHADEGVGGGNDRSSTGAA